MNLRDFINAARDSQPVDDGTQWQPTRWDREVRPAWTKARNDATLANAKRKHQTWTAHEIRIVTDPDRTAAEAAKAAGRTLNSVIRKRSRLKRASR